MKHTPVGPTHQCTSTRQYTTRTRTMIPCRVGIGCMFVAVSPHIAFSTPPVNSLDLIAPPGVSTTVSRSLASESIQQLMVIGTRPRLGFSHSVTPGGVAVSVRFRCRPPSFGCCRVLSPRSSSLQLLMNTWSTFGW